MVVDPNKDTALTVRDESPFGQLVRMADALGRNKLFGMTKDEILPLMLIAQAEGRHPATAAMEYDIIQGKPALKSKAIHARFNAAGGRVAWITRDDKCAKAKFTAKNGDTCEVAWDMDRVKAAGLATREMYGKYSRQMLSARCLAEGVRAVDPGCLNGMYGTEEIGDEPDMMDVTPERMPDAYASGGAPTDTPPTTTTTTAATGKPSVLDNFVDDIPEKTPKGRIVNVQTGEMLKGKDDLF